MNQTITLMTVFVVLNITPFAIWALEKLAEWFKGKFGETNRTYRIANIIIKLFEIAVGIEMAVLYVMNPVDGIEVPVWNFIIQCIIVAGWEIRALLSAKRDVVKYLTNEASDVGTAVISIILCLVLTGYFALFLVIAYVGWL